MISYKKSSVLNVFTNYISIISSMFVGFLLPPLAFKYLNAENYGIYSLLTAILSYIIISGFGIDTATSVLIAKEENFENKKKIFTSSLKIALFISVILVLIILLFFYFKVDLSFLLGKINLENKLIASKSVFVYLFLGALSLIFSVISGALSGFQKQHLDNIIKSLLSISPLFSIAIILVFNSNFYTFILLNALFFIAINLIRVLLIIFVLNQRLISIFKFNIKTLVNIDFSLLKKIFSSGIGFWLLGIGTFIITSFDNFIIAFVLTTDQVGKYSTVYRVINVLFTLVMFANSSQMPIIGRKISENNFKSIFDTYKKMLNITLLSSLVIYSLIIVFGPVFFTSWIGSKNYIGDYPVYLLSLYGILYCYTNINIVFASAFNIAKKLSKFTLFEAIIHLILAFTLSHLFGVLGLVLGAIISHIITSFWGSYYVLKKHSVYEFNNIKFYFKTNKILLFMIGTLLYFLIMEYFKFNITYLNYLIFPLLFFIFSKEFKVFIFDLKEILNSFFKKA